jgi:hypothetical protein
MHSSRLAGLIIDRQGADLQRVHTWWVMEAPTGQRFCVVPRVVTVIDRWHGLMRSRDMSGLDSLLADTVVFESPALLEFNCRLGEVEVDGIDMINWSEAGQITRFKVMVRPFKALQTLMTQMAAELARG